MHLGVLFTWFWDTGISITGAEFNLVSSMYTELPNLVLYYSVRTFADTNQRLLPIVSVVLIQ